MPTGAPLHGEPVIPTTSSVNVVEEVAKQGVLHILDGAGAKIVTKQILYHPLELGRAVGHSEGDDFPLEQSQGGLTKIACTS